MDDMGLLYDEKKEQSQGILATVRQKEPILDINCKKENILQTILRQKQLIIYVEDNRCFVEHADGYANTRAIMLENSKMLEIR